MPKFAKRFLAVAAAFLGVIALVLLCINLYLQSGGVQQRIRAAAEKALGAEIKIRSTSYTPWGGLFLGGLTLPDPTTPGRDIVDARGLRVRFALWPLLQQRFIVGECKLLEPKLIVRQSADGNWILPLPGRRAVEVEAPDGPKGPAIKGPSFRAELQRFKLAEGTILFIDAKSRPVLALDKVDIDAAVAQDLTAKGTFYVARVEVSKSLKPNKIGGPFTWDGKILDFPEIKGFLAGGNLLASYRLQTGSAPQFGLAANLDGVLLKKLAEDANVDPGKTEGQLKGTLSIAGDPRNSDTLNGNGHFELVAAQLKPMEFLVKLGELFQIDELQLLKLHDAKVDITIANERAQIDNLVLKSENLMITATGPVRFNGKLNIDARLLVNAKLQRQLKGVMGNNFVESEFPEYRQLPFTVTGRVDNPKTDLLDKIIGIKIGGDVQGLLNNLFQGPPKKKPDNKQNDNK